MLTFGLKEGFFPLFFGFEKWLHVDILCVLE